MKKDTLNLLDGVSSLHSSAMISRCTYNNALVRQLLMRYNTFQSISKEDFVQSTILAVTITEKIRGSEVNDVFGYFH